MVTQSLDPLHSLSVAELLGEARIQTSANSNFARGAIVNVSSFGIFGGEQLERSSWNMVEYWMLINELLEDPYV